MEKMKGLPVLRLILIRHGQTAGNLEKRYVGKTDEALAEAGICLLNEKKARHTYPPADVVITTPYRRCLQTAKFLYPETEMHIEPQLGEMDFGEFEYRNYIELSGNTAYQAWIDSGGTAAFPGGEGMDAFEERCQSAFCRAIKELIQENIKKDIKKEETDNAEKLQQAIPTAALVVHGGTIMALLHRMGIPKQEYFSYQCKNGDGYTAELYCGETGFQIRQIQKLKGQEETT
jgi:alpha-ribazole phosphatase